MTSLIRKQHESGVARREAQNKFFDQMKHGEDDEDDNCEQFLEKSAEHSVSEEIRQNDAKMMHDKRCQQILGGK